MTRQLFPRETKDRALNNNDPPIWTTDDNGVFRPMTLEEMNKAGIRRITDVRSIETGT